VVDVSGFVLNENFQPIFLLDIFLMSEDGAKQPEASNSTSKDGAERTSDDQTEIPVVVAVHIRPLIHDELMTGCRECLTVADGSSQVRCEDDADTIRLFCKIPMRQACQDMQQT
jgi:hypothetical protein